jgi:hypothetical protein
MTSASGSRIAPVSSARKVLRWLLVPIAGLAAWWLAIFIMAGLDFLYWQFDYPCPKAEILSGACAAASYDWFTAYTHLLFCVGAALAAALVVLACTMAAPRHKLRTAFAAYVVGAGAAFLMTNLTGELLAGFFALASGGATVAALWRRFRSQARAQRGINPAVPLPSIRADD